MPIFAYKLFGPRPSFPMDITPEEAAIMGEHVAYWTERAREGAAVAFGPVHDPAGVWGIAIVDAESQAAADSLRESDPAFVKGLGRVEIYPMPGAITREATTAASLRGPGSSHSQST